MALTTTTVHLVEGPADDAEESANPSRSSTRTNKLGLREPGTLKVAANDGTVPPSDGNTLIIGPDLARALGDQLGLKVELFTVESPSDMINGLLNRKDENALAPGPPAETFDLAMPGGPDDFDGDEQDPALIHYFDVGYAVVAPWETAQDIRVREKCQMAWTSYSKGSGQLLVHDDAGSAVLSVGAAVDLLPAQRAPEDEGGGIVLQDGETDAVPVLAPEPLLNQVGQQSADALAVKVAVHHQQPDPGLAICRVTVEQAQ